MPLSALSVSRPVTVLMFYLGVVMLGIIAFFNLSVGGSYASAANMVLTFLGKRLSF